MPEYYLYRHIRLDKNEPFYIGIGKKKKSFYSYNTEYSRAFDKRNRNSIWKNIINKTLYKVDILFESSNLKEIEQKEIEFIKLYGRINTLSGCLSNMTDGGGGLLNPSLSTIEKLKISHLGQTAWNKGIPCSESAKNKISIANKGRISNRKGCTLSEETKEKLRRANIGKHLSKETKEKMSISRKGRIVSDKTIQKLIERNKNRVWTERMRKEAGERLRKAKLKNAGK